MTQPAPAALQPEQLLMQMATGKWVSKALSVVADLGIPDLLGEGPRSVDDLATRSAVIPTESLVAIVEAVSQ